MNVAEYLGQQYIPFELVEHHPAYDAQHLASAVHESGYHVAKTVLLIGESETYVVAVLSAKDRIDMERVGQILEDRGVRLATEEEVAGRFPDCELGVVPPFGAHYGLKTLVDVALSREDEIVFEGATHAQAIKMKYKDYQQLEQPIVVEFAQPANP